MKNYLFLLLSLPFFIACNGDQNKAAVEKPKTVESKPAPAPVKKMVEFLPVPQSAETAKYADAQLKTMNYKKGKFTFTFSGKNYKLGKQTPDAGQLRCANSDKGQHIHLIIDNQPYYALYTPEFELAVPDGEHIILAFLSRSYHQSIKNGKAYLAKKVKIVKGSIVSSSNVKEPMVFYSRPKGTYIGEKETENILLDYFLVNVKPEDKLSVQVQINNGNPLVMSEWKSHFISGLPMGENTIKLTLIDKGGNPLKTPLNPVERTFTLKEDPLTAQ